MKRFSVRAAVAAALVGVMTLQADAVTVGGLRVENQAGVVTVDGRATPRLGWQLADDGRRGVMQGAYRVVVATTAEKLSKEEGDLWDSGRVALGDSVLVTYGGKPVEAGQVAYWKVKVWDEKGGESAWSAAGNWRAGLTSWEGKWIGYPGDDGDKVVEAAPCFRKEFAVRAGLVRATAYVCGLGQYELTLNGEKVGEAALAPGWSNYAKTCLYDTYDVTKQIKEGGNAVGVMLGNGMYNVLKVQGRYTKFVGTFGAPKVIGEIVCEYGDGRREVVGTDGSWKAARGPVVFTHMYGGEDYDARQAMSGWNVAGFGDGEWKGAAVVEGPGGGKAELVAAMEPAVGEAQSFGVVRETTPREGVRVFDFGQNMSGRPRVKVKGAAGAVVRLVPGELLGSDGAVSQRSSGSPVWFEYTCKGGGEEVWEPRFSYYGFRYVQATVKGEAAITGIEGVFTHAALPAAGTFKSSDETLNKIHTLINMAILSNAQSVLTDCPHREKLGWLEQSYLVGDAVMMNWDVSGLYTKIARDMREAQTEEGLVPDIAPEYVKFAGGFRDAPEWGSAAVLDPWLMYVYYGDKGVLAAEYETNKKYVAYLRGKSKEGIVGYGLGDWFDIGPKKLGAAQLTSLELTGTATYYRDLVTMGETARVLGKAEDAAAFEKEAAGVKAAFNAKFFDAETGVYEKGSQTALAMPLAVGLVADDQRERVTENLVKQVREAKNRVTAGDVGFSYVVKALTDAGRGDLLLDMATQGEGPGYVDQLRKGATTLTEAWDANPADSQNHLMLGHIEAWFYRGLAGIQAAETEQGAGFGEVVIAPQVVGNVQWVEASVETVRGKVSSAWKKEGGGLTLRVEVPGNVRARIVVPAGRAEAVREGEVEASKADGVKVVGVRRGVVVLEVGSGAYVFHVAREPGAMGGVGPR